MSEALSLEILDYYYDENEKVELAIWNLRFSVQSDSREDTNWAFESLSKNKDYLKDLNRKRQIMPQTCRDLSRTQYKSDEKYCNRPLNYFSQEEIAKLAVGQWIHDIGQMKQFAGDSEMILFTHLFNLHIILFKNTMQGTAIENTAFYLLMIKNPNTPDREFEKPNLNNTIFMWAMNADNPCHPLEADESTEHYVTLNVTTKEDPFVGPDIFTFERVTWDQHIKNENEMSEQT
jgi:hypothetical protein